MPICKVMAGVAEEVKEEEGTFDQFQTIGCSVSVRRKVRKALQVNQELPPCVLTV